MALRTTSLSEARTCDVCAISGYAPLRLAVWDSPAVGGRWGFLCREHGAQYGAARLTVGTRITYPEPVKAAFMREYRRMAAKR